MTLPEKTVTIDLTVIICCYNSEKVIERTLLALTQQSSSNFSWDVVLVDNNCKDRTSALAREVWIKSRATQKLTIVSEPTPGLADARRCGVKSTQADIIVFCDDDNSLSEYYVNTVFDFFRTNAEVSIVGGCGTAVTQNEFPDWFERYEKAYAVGPQGEGREQKTGHFYGAGMSIRSQPLRDAYLGKFRTLLSGRKGGKLSAGDDGEIQEWFRIFDHKTKYYLPELTFEHFLDPSRLKWPHLTKLYQGFGEMAPVLEIYRKLERNEYQPIPYLWSRNIFKFFMILILRSFDRRGIADSVLKLGRNYSSLRWLVRNRGEFKSMMQDVISMRNYAENQQTRTSQDEVSSSHAVKEG